jgi:hypothetical protein
MSVTRTTALGLLCLAISVPSAVIQAQVQATSDREVFDVVSIREARSGSPSSGIRLHPSGLTATGSTALDLIRHAFDVVDADVIGELPAWIRTTKFDVVARTSGEPLTHSR